MTCLRYFILGLLLVLSACSSLNKRGTIAELHHKEIEIREEEISGGLEKAMESYQRFLQETPGSAMAPEAIRRLADLKVEKEYGYVTDGAVQPKARPALSAPEAAPRPKALESKSQQAPAPDGGESEADFERRATLNQPVPSQIPPEPIDDHVPDDLERAGPLEAIALYQKLFNEYPLYPRNDQVLYQMSRAYEELGRIEEAMEVMDRLVRQYPRSRYLDEVQFRRAEYFFTHRKYLDAEDAYRSIVNIGVGSFYYELALYKLGWTFYKQELYEEAQHKFIAVLDYKVSVGYDFDQAQDEIERKRIDDTFRVISLGFSYLGGAESVVDYFSRFGHRGYEDSIYENLAEYYYTKRRYSDAVAAYDAFVSRNPFHKKSPLFHMRIIAINMAGGFPSLVIETKKSFAVNYGLKAEYWKYFEPADRPEVVGFLKTNLIDLANHYHALYQNPKWVKEKPGNFVEAQHWYREFLVSFPKGQDTPAIHYQFADLLLENRSFAQAAVEYEKTAYAYEPHKQSSKAGYAAVYAYRQQLETTPDDGKLPVKKEVVRSSLKFVDTFPAHEKAAVVLGAAADDLFVMAEHEQALTVARQLIDGYPSADINVRRSAWLVVAHSSYELEFYSEAEKAYVEVLGLLPSKDETRAGLIDNLAAAIYKQGERANAIQDYSTAADHFLRVGVMAPTSKIRATAEFDAATALIQLKAWGRAAAVLVAFRTNFPDHELQPEVTKKMAYVYREDGKLSKAAGEYERIEQESKDDEVRREALQVAAELYEKANDVNRTLAVYQRYVDNFPQPVEIHLETRNKIAEIFKKQEKRKKYLKELRQIVAIDVGAGKDRTDRTRYLGAKAALVLAELSYENFTAVRLAKPFKTNLAKKQKLMKAATKEFSSLIDYQVGEVTAAATFYLAEIYAHFSKALMGSERPVLGFDLHLVQSGDNLSKIAKSYGADVDRIANENNLNSARTIVVGQKLKIPRGLEPAELEEYEMALEEQAYPFEEKAISVHQSNLELMALGIYNEWIEKSLEKLAVFVPARYAKQEDESPLMTSLDGFSFTIVRPASEKAALDQGSAAPSGQVSVPKENDLPAAEAAESLEEQDKQGNLMPAAKDQAVPEKAEEGVAQESGTNRKGGE